MKIFHILTLLMTLSLSYAQTSNLPIPISSYESHLEIMQGERKVGYYEETLSKTDGKEWEFNSQKIYLTEDGKFRKQEQFKIAFDPTLQWKSYQKNVTNLISNNRSWYKAEVKEGTIFLSNSKNQKQTLLMDPRIIPGELLRFHFVSQSEEKQEYRALDLASGKTVPFSYRNTGTIEQPWTNPTNKKEKIKVMVVEERKMTTVPGKKVPPPALLYLVVSKGPEEPGTLVRKKVGSSLYIPIPKEKFLEHVYSWRPRQEYDPDVQIARLKNAVANLLDENWQTRYEAVQDIQHLGLIQGVPALIEMLNDEHEKIRSKAYIALRRMTRMDFSEDAKQWRFWWINIKKPSLETPEEKKDEESSEEPTETPEEKKEEEPSEEYSE